MGSEFEGKRGKGELAWWWLRGMDDGVGKQGDSKSMIEGRSGWREGRTEAVSGWYGIERT